MSLILEALRKSEAERRRAQDTATLAEPAAAPHRGGAQLPRWFWPLVAASGLLLVAWLTRGSWLPSAETRPAVEGVAIADTAFAPPRDVPVPGPVDGVPVTPASSSPSATSLDTASVAASTTTPSAVAVITSAAASAPPTAVANGTTNPPVSSTRAPAPIPPAEPIWPLASEAAPLSTPARPTPAPTMPAPAPAPATSSAASQALRLSDLGTEERQQLPPLKMSMHMWAPEPSQRFAIIDGNRVREGDRVGNAVIDSIDADGLVLGWNGRRLRVPVR